MPRIRAHRCPSAGPQSARGNPTGLP